MNGQMYQIAKIVVAAKKAMQTNAQIQYELVMGENSVQFQFLPEKWLLGTRSYTAKTVEEWFERVRKSGLQDIKLFAPWKVENRHLLGFSNTTQSAILCFYENGKVSYFMPNWEFDRAKKGWNVLYTEKEWPNPPEGKPGYEDNTESFRQILVDIQQFALQIGSKIFANVFGHAISVLDGENEDPDKKPFLDLPKCNLRIIEAASIADVFGGMSSWNDDPHVMAHEKGLTREYDLLSDELLKNIRLAIMYAINEW